MSDEEGSLRLLTLGEIALARTVYGSSITYPRVWIHHDSYFPFKLQGKTTAMSPNGELYFRDWYCDDFSKNHSSINTFLSMKWLMSGSINEVYGSE
ncbi:hypothetical protein ACNF5A_000273 [Kosakonia cowanii]|uniref:hypothetical protein n=1 Tax=Kosakonia cowanii TaxID=208223 RepID=UPI003B67C9C4